MRSGSSAGTSDRILNFSSFASEARVLLSSPGMSNAAETIPSCESDRSRLKKRPKKIPLLQLTVQSQSGCNLESTGSRKHAVHQPAHDPVPLIASRGQVLKVTSSIRSLEMHAAHHEVFLYFQYAPGVVWGGRLLGLCQCDTIGCWRLGIGLLAFSLPLPPLRQARAF